MENDRPRPAPEHLSAGQGAAGRRVAARLTLPQVIAQARTAYGNRDWDRAEQLCRAVLAARADQFDALMLLGAIAAQTGRAAEASGLLERACAIQPGSAPAHNNLANVLRDLGRRDAALAAYDRAIALAPDYAAAYANRANVLKELGQLDAAVAGYNKAIALAPGNAPACLQRGDALRELGRLDAALASYDQALAARPDDAEAHVMRGRLLEDLERPDEAVAAYDDAIAVRPGHAEAHFKRANALQELRRLGEAVAGYDRAIAARPDYPEARINKALTMLLCGRFGDGWPAYEARWQQHDIRQFDRGFAQPLWLGGEPIAGRTILLHAEQGLGDAIQFCRYAPLVAALGARVVLEVPGPLAPLMHGLDGVSAVIRRGAPLPPFDLHCPLMSLPLAFRTGLDSIPAPRAYLHSDAGLRSKWSARLGPKQAARVGIVWSGGTRHPNDRKRSIPLAQFRRLLPPGWEPVSLQKEVREEDRAALQAEPAITHLGEEIADFADTAALCDLMDLVVSVDTSVAHLAGALGRPVWLLLPWVPDWRWLLDRSDSPWYPTARLYRQQRRGEWDPVLEQVRTDLAALASRGALQ